MSTTFKGIHSEEKLFCGCLIKRYVGGKVIFEASHKCTYIPKHKTSVKHICGVCGLETSKLRLKHHKNKEHAI